ncbi:Cell division protein FtsZ [compost metagenome]
MRDELHVTVVATGLGARMEKPTKVVDNAPAATPAPQGASVNYRDLERPTVMRSSQGTGGAAPAVTLSTQEDLDYLDIPAFLRRQAD